MGNKKQVKITYEVLAPKFVESKNDYDWTLDEQGNVIQGHWENVWYDGNSEVVDADKVAERLKILNKLDNYRNIKTEEL